MEWIEAGIAKKYAIDLMASQAPQTLVLAADASALANAIPIKPILSRSNGGSAATVFRWYALIAGRVIEIECELDPTRVSESVVIYTVFAGPQKQVGDWEVLKDLVALPRPIYATRPLYIESRNNPPINVVYREHSQGWKTPVFNAASRSEAKDLIEFLRNDDWNGTCFVGDPEPQGKWATIQGDEQIAGIGSGLNNALRFACEWSQKYPEKSFVVKDVSGNCNETYVICRGRVLQPASRY